MKGLSCFVVDDEFSAIDFLQRFIERTPGLDFSGSSEKPLEALDIINAKHPSITFLDINMQEMTGIELVKLFRSKTSVIFTTAFQEYALDAFNLEATDFLLKPFTYDRFLQAVNRVKLKNANFSSTEEGLAGGFFFVKSGARGRMVRVDLKEIVHIGAVDNYIEFYMSDQTKVMTYLTMWQIEENLPHESFVRVKKSSIVNLEKIRLVEKGGIVLTDNTLIMVGEKYRERFDEQMAKRSIISVRHQ